MKTTTILFATLILAGSVLLSSCANQKSEIPALTEGNATAPTVLEQATIKEAYDKAVMKIKSNPDDLQQYLNIAMAFIAEGRITGNNNYYSNAAMKMLNKVTDKTTGSKDLVFQSLSLRSAVLLNMHQFRDALDAANQGVVLNSCNSGIFGALVDANVEMGNYDEAVKDCDKMMAIRPDLRSYSRASYLRQIYGQNAGAIAAMKMAVDAGLPGAESTEWARTKLGDLYLDNGNTDSASIVYRTSLVYRPGYPYALVGMARVCKARKEYDGAITYAKNAIGVVSESAFVTLLADLYELKGDMAKAKETRSEVADLMEQSRKDEPANALVKHNVNRELAMAWLNAGNLDKALQYANADLLMRPENIDANELVSWTYYLRGDYAQAKMHADKMLVTNTRNAATLYKAGAIYTAAGNTQKGVSLMHDALTINPNIDQLLVAKTKTLNSKPVAVR